MDDDLASAEELEQAKHLVEIGYFDDVPSALGALRNMDENSYRALTEAIELPEYEERSA